MYGVKGYELQPNGERCVYWKFDAQPHLVRLVHIWICLESTVVKHEAVSELACSLCVLYIGVDRRMK